MHKHLSRIHSQDTSYLQHLPKNQNISAVIELLVTAHHSYIPTKTGKACVLMLVQPMSMNIADERPIESGLWDAEIPCYRCEWEDMLEQTTLSADQTLLFHLNGGDGGIEVGLVYYRAGCEPWEYEHEGKEIRLRCEMSKAVKCPDVLTHLTTMKVVQCALTQPGSLERFLPKQKATMIRQTFMPMQLLDTTPEGLGSRRIASDKERAESYILKPNLEGGRHNIYRSDIPEFLASVPQEEWHKFILMRLIEPPPDVQGFLMTAKDMYHGAVVCELGILGTCVWERRAGSEINPLNNKVAGWTFKTKPAAADEMNVIKGLGCFDCPFLV
ncbi:glutathione synthetase ATP-binding domain-like protein [Myriangium duriaei CBS 260.36]|uniref:Glutathione synthetase ATP-binding domain-like protein n=1 Tax=Myriangium duriaei CBS 260.36 TaxID=1168546 RepID=A0A9P4JAJ1_9PEZI|nr:glutathione synthetase ATP-binding domain-like protein [Myriangium duriaei CBS 260.36]